jgi:hypothetical protein
LPDLNYSFKQLAVGTPESNNPNDTRLVYQFEIVDGTKTQTQLNQLFDDLVQEIRGQFPIRKRTVLQAKNLCAALHPNDTWAVDGDEITRA